MNPRITRRTALALGLTAGLGTLAGCLGGGAPAEPSASTSERPTPDAIPLAPARLPVTDEFATLRRATVSGGPGKDGIPSIDDPTFVDPAGAPAWLTDEDPVFGLVGESDVKAYPQEILVWHEICNDVVDGTPVAVTYCPLTGTAMGFERGGTTFGVSGDLVNSNLVMYDRETDSRWPQILATAISGPYEGASLREFRLQWSTWGEWRDAHPDTELLSAETGYVRNYGGDPYGQYAPLEGYYAQNSTMFAPIRGTDRLHRKRVVLGTRSGGAAVAFDVPTLRARGWLTTTVGGTDYLAVAGGPGTTGWVYRNDQGLSVERVADGEVTLDSGGTYPAADLPLPGQYAFAAMWFAWFAFYPTTALVVDASVPWEAAHDGESASTDERLNGQADREAGLA